MAANAAARTLSPAKNYSPKTFRLIAICFVLSGATGLIYEVLWARMLGLVFGATTLAISAVLAAFMGGLALGSALAGRLGSRLTKPVGTYGLIEIAIGLYALAVPALFRGIDSVYAQVWQHLHPGFYGFAFSRFALAGIVLVIPTALMGATLPVLVGAARRSDGYRATAVTRLYTCNLAGAILGAIAAGFFLLPSLGVRVTIWIAAGTNLAIGLVAVLIERKTFHTADAPGEVDESSQVVGSSVSFGNARFWLFCAFTSGLITISMQLVWSRILAMIIGSSTYAFSIVLALFLIGLALGAYIVSLRKNQDLSSLRRAVLIVQTLTAASLFLSLRITSETPSLLIRAGLRLGIHSWFGLLTLQVAAAALLLLLPAVLMGMIMPLVLTWAGNMGSTDSANLDSIDSRSGVRLVGQSYAVNTIGAIGGALVTAFLLIPGTSTRFTIFCVASLCLMVAGVAYEPKRASFDRATLRSLAIGIALAMGFVMFVTWPRLNLNALSAGAYDSFVRLLAKARGDHPEDTRSDQPSDHKLLMYEEGRTATVSVRRDWDVTSVAINGRTNASDVDDMPTQVILGQLGMLIAPRPANALMIGFATGVTAGSVLQSPIQSVECVEIEPAAVASSRYFEHVNNKPLSDPRSRLILDDARTYLRVNPEKYDLIISEPSHPWVPGVANLFTREFFTLGRERLRDDGVFVQWFQIYQLSTESLRSVLATFHEVFPHIAVFRVQGAAKGKDLILLGSRQALSLDRIDERMKDSRAQADLARIGIKTADDVRAWFVCDESQLGPAVAGAIINTDDNMHVETVAPREAFRPTLEENAVWIQALKNKPIARP